MEWYESCVNPTVATTRYENVPDLSDFHVNNFDLCNAQFLYIYGFLPRLPDHYWLPDDQKPEKTELMLSFSNLCDLQVSGMPSNIPGELTITKQNDAKTSFEFQTNGFRFSGTCEQAAIGGIAVLGSCDPRAQGPRDARLYSHYNVWNSCLLLLREYGYSLRVSGRLGQHANTSHIKWHATNAKDGSKFIGNTPIELLGLAPLHRHHTPEMYKPYWWRIEGEPLVLELIREWERQSANMNANENC